MDWTESVKIWRDNGSKFSENNTHYFHYFKYESTRIFSMNSFGLYLCLVKPNACQSICNCWANSNCFVYVFMTIKIHICVLLHQSEYIIATILAAITVIHKQCALNTFISDHLHWFVVIKLPLCLRIMA